jgi:hypothetical protein
MKSVACNQQNADLPDPISLQTTSNHPLVPSCLFGCWGFVLVMKITAGEFVNLLELRNVVPRKKRLASLAEPTLYCHLFRQQLLDLFD